MQTSIRSSYQYYNDYGTLDCATGHINQDLHHHQHHHQLPSEESVNPLNHHNHQHIQQPHLTASSSHHQHHHQLLQVSSQGAFGNLQLASNGEVVPPVDDGCYPQDPQDISIQQQPQQDDTRTLPGAETLVIYDHQTHQEYQLLAANNNDPSCTNQTTDIGGDLSLEVENIYQQQRQQYVQTTSTYQTMYYEPINFTDNNTPLEPNPPVHQDTGEPQEQHEFSASHHLVQLNQFSEAHHHHNQSELQQQPQISSGEDGCTYFQYLHHQNPNETDLTSARPTDNQNTESTLPLAIDNLQQQQQTIIYTTEGHRATIDETQNHDQIYHVLGDTKQHPFAHLDQTTTQGDPQFRLNPSDGQLETAIVDVNLQHPGEEFKQDHQYLNHHVGHNDDQEPQIYQHHQNFYLNSESTGVSIAYSQESRSSTASPSPSEESSASTLTRDEKRAREANIPMTYYEIVNLTIEQFNERLTRHNLSESQLTLIKDIRRRGKNKVAAQSCRKRKMEQIYELQHEVNNLAYKRRSLSIECSQLIKEHGDLVQEYDMIYGIIQERMQC